MSSSGKGRRDDATQHSQGRPGKGPNSAKDKHWGAGGYGKSASLWPIYPHENNWLQDGDWQHGWQSYVYWPTSWPQKSETGSSGEWSKGSVGWNDFPATSKGKSWTEMGSSGKGSKKSGRKKGRDSSTLVSGPVSVFRSRAAPLDSQGGSQPVPVPGGSQPEAQCGTRVAGKAYSRPDPGMASETQEGTEENSESAGSGDQQTQQKDGTGEDPTQSPPANTGVDGSADTDAAAASPSPQGKSSTEKPEIAFQFLENNKGDVSFWQTVDDYMCQSLYDCLKMPDGERTIEIWLYFGKPECKNYQNYYVVLNDNAMWLQTNAKTGHERELRCVKITPVVPALIKGSQPIPNDGALWWQYEDEFGWKNVNPAANEQLLQACRAGELHVDIVHKWNHPRWGNERVTTYAYDLIGMQATNKTSMKQRPARIVHMEEIRAV